MTVARADATQATTPQPGPGSADPSWVLPGEAIRRRIVAEHREAQPEEWHWVTGRERFAPPAVSPHTDFAALITEESVRLRLRTALSRSVAEYVMRATADALNELRERIARLETAQEAPTRMLAISEVPGYRFRAPLSASVQNIDGGYLVSVPEVDVWADGFSESAAIAEAKAMVADLAADVLASPDDTLGPDPLRWKGLFLRIVE